LSPASRLRFSARLENFERRYLKPALADGVLEMTRPDKPNSRLQKYRLTEAGKKLLGEKRADPPRTAAY
jgi:ATP-dependent DNA helicase RecG